MVTKMASLVKYVRLLPKSSTPASVLVVPFLMTLFFVLKAISLLILFDFVGVLAPLGAYFANSRQLCPLQLVTEAKHLQKKKYIYLFIYFRI